MNKKIVWTLIAIIVIAGIYYALAHRATYQTQEPTAPAAGMQPSVTTKPALSVMTDPTLGSYLVAANGFTVYTFKNDKPDTSNCYDACATNWPPYVVPASGAMAADPAVTGKLGTAQRKDGMIQLTYNDMPLYFWINDKKVGDTKGQGVNNVWFVVHP